MKKDILGYSLIELEQLVTETYGMPKFRAKQIYQWLHKEMVDDFETMSNVPKELRAKLATDYMIPTLGVVKKFQSKDGSAKYLFDIGHDTIVESVLMDNNYGYSICVSTQVGCKMGCTFCASHIGGFEKNLSTGEILKQVYTIQKDLDKKISNLVIMGIGEPMDNYDNVMRFIRNLSDEAGLNLSQRSITVSTCGIVPKMYDLAEEGLAVTLAISIHAGDDVTRKRIMPIANAYTMDEIVAAAHNYFEKTKRRVSYEYVMIKEVNDHLAQARLLGKRLEKTNSHVNLIPLNPVTEAGYTNTVDKHIKEFARILESYNVDTTIRRNQGQDIEAACGQLRKTHKEEAAL